MRASNDNFVEHFRSLESNGNVFPFGVFSLAMHRKLSDDQILATARAVLSRHPSASGRLLRAELRRRFGSAGRTDRVFSLWRSLTRASASPSPPSEAPTVLSSPPWLDGSSTEALLREARERVRRAEEARDAAIARAERAEAREIAHQDRWANEIHDLRERVRALAAQAARALPLERRLMELTREQQQLIARLALYECTETGKGGT